MSWKDVFDSEKYNWINSSMHLIGEINKFLFQNTAYRFFCFNGIVFKVMNYSQWDYEQAKTDFRFEDLF